MIDMWGGYNNLGDHGYCHFTVDYSDCRNPFVDPGTSLIDDSIEIIDAFNGVTERSLKAKVESETAAEALITAVHKSNKTWRAFSPSLVKERVRCILSLQRNTPKR